MLWIRLAVPIKKRDHEWTISLVYLGFGLIDLMTLLYVIIIILLN